MNGIGKCILEPKNTAGMEIMRVNTQMKHCADVNWPRVYACMYVCACGTFPAFSGCKGEGWLIWIEAEAVLLYGSDIH